MIIYHQTLILKRVEANPISKPCTNGDLFFSFYFCPFLLTYQLKITFKIINEIDLSYYLLNFS